MTSPVSLLSRALNELCTQPVHQAGGDCIQQDEDSSRGVGEHFRLGILGTADDSFGDLTRGLDDPNWLAGTVTLVFGYVEEFRRSTDRKDQTHINSAAN